MPEVGIYDSPEVNAFATGPQQEPEPGGRVDGPAARRCATNEVEGVLAHEVAHIANGDMVTMTLIQGVMNAFVMFLARLIASGVRATRATTRGNGDSYMLVVMIVLEMVLGIAGLDGHRVVLAAARVPGRLRRRHAGGPREHAGGAAAAGREPAADRPAATRRWPR